MKELDSDDFTLNNEVLINDIDLIRKYYKFDIYELNIQDRSLGQGTYGTILLSETKEKKRYAIKCCKIEDKGIPNLLEPSIMNTIIHPNINYSIRTFASNQDLYIIQEIAECDLLTFTRREKNNYRPTITMLSKWCFSIIQAVGVLHHEKIIHADIKSNNILLYSNYDVKLTDFTLSVKNWTGNGFNHKACTSTHRPPECFRGNRWNEKLDIWSLGCTLYEIAYGMLLFPHQKKDENDRESSKKYINAIIDWYSIYRLGKTIDDKKEINFNRVVFPLEYYKPEYIEFNFMINDMLNINQDKRPLTDNILSSPFFSGMKKNSYYTVKNKYRRIEDEKEVFELFSILTDNENIIYLASELFHKTSLMESISRDNRISTCYFIAHKIILNSVPKNYPKEIIEYEKSVCNYLSFRLHD